jgi:hypothetical protein
MTVGGLSGLRGELDGVDPCPGKLKDAVEGRADAHVVTSLVRRRCANPSNLGKSARWRVTCGCVRGPAGRLGDQQVAVAAEAASWPSPGEVLGVECDRSLPGAWVPGCVAGVGRGTGVWR